MSLWQELIGNLAVVALSVFGWEVLNQRLEKTPVGIRHLIFAVIMGVSAVVSMMLAVHIPGGIIFDLRSSIIAISGFFGGPLAGLVSGAIAGSYRAWAGGTGMSAGLTVIALATGAGIVGNAMAHQRPNAIWQILALSAAAAGAMLVGMLSLPGSKGLVAVTEFGLPVLGLTFVATLVSGLIILQGRRLSDERRLLVAALHQSPDFQYIKDRQSRFVVINQLAAERHGFSDPAELRGKTDFDISEPRHARALHAQEQYLLATGQPIKDHVESIEDAYGETRWFSTSKSAVVGRDGDVVGLVGVTHDITRQKRTESDLTQSRNLLSAALSGMSDGLAMFDANDVLMFCNERYREIFSLTAHLRMPGTPLRRILEAVAEVGEQVGIPEDNVEGWIEAVIDTVHKKTEREVNLSNGHWVRVRTGRTEDGISIVTVSDITQAKLAQEALLTLTDQLKSLAGTDGLTGLPNRRAFDQTLDDEMKRTAESGEPLSLLMIDVDFFKPFNDIYGHLAGDDCLKTISKCLQQLVREPRDVAARFGGEEFAMILPDTDADDAHFLAEEIRSLLAERAIVHGGNVPPFVTVSIGVATVGAHVRRRNPAELVRRADAALYSAKRTGRNRTVIWNAKTIDTNSSAA
ncbi:MAG: diguanylate cyclase [Alphaproteobacteria bacterium]|nr:diguanylate cyclase [Alphaproteobacteria bacterium]